MGQALIPYYTGVIIDYASIDPDADAFQWTCVKLVVVALGCAVFTGVRGGLFTVCWRHNPHNPFSSSPAPAKQSMQQSSYSTVGHSIKEKLKSPAAAPDAQFDAKFDANDKVSYALVLG